MGLERCRGAETWGRTYSDQSRVKEEWLETLETHQGPMSRQEVRLQKLVIQSEDRGWKTRATHTQKSRENL